MYNYNTIEIVELKQLPISDGLRQFHSFCCLGNNLLYFRLKGSIQTLKIIQYFELISKF